MAEELYSGVSDDIYADVEGFELESKRPKGRYFSIFKNRLALRSKEVVDGWEGPFETRHPITDKIVISYAQFYDRLVVRIINITREKKDFSAQGGGKAIQWNIRVLANGKKATLQFNQKDSTLTRLLKVIRNVKFDRPIAISAWKGFDKKNNKEHQAMSFYQPSDELIATRDPNKIKNLDNWTKVDEYWKRALDENGKPVEGVPSLGADGTILPQPIQDEDEEWDFREQTKFLISQFRQHIEPQMIDIAAKYGATVENEDSTPEFSGPEEIPVVTEKPTNPMATSMRDALTGEQRAKCMQLAQQLGQNPDAIAQKLLGANLDEISKNAASYLEYRMSRKIAKNAPPVTAPTGSLPPTAAPQPAPEPAPVVAAPVAQAPAPAPAATEDDDDWGVPAAPSVVAQAPATPSVVAAAPKVADDDDDDWGEPAKPAVSPNDDVPF